MSDLPTIAVVGGTGNLGYGIALRLAKAGYPVIIGSREADKAQGAADEMTAKLGAGAKVRGLANGEAAAQADIIFMAVPFASHDATLGQIAPHVRGKIVVDTTVPLVPPKVARVHLVAEGSAANRAQKTLGPEVRVVSALQNVAAAHLRELDHAIDCDVLVTGDDKAARQAVIDLIAAMGLKAWHAGPLDNAVVAESLTSILIFINKNHGIDGAGIRISGEPSAS